MKQQSILNTLSLINSPLHLHTSILFFKQKAPPSSHIPKARKKKELFHWTTIVIHMKENLNPFLSMFIKQIHFHQPITYLSLAYKPFSSLSPSLASLQTPSSLSKSTHSFTPYNPSFTFRYFQPWILSFTDPIQRDSTCSNSKHISSCG